MIYFQNLLCPVCKEAESFWSPALVSSERLLRENCSHIIVSLIGSKSVLVLHITKVFQFCALHPSWLDSSVFHWNCTQLPIISFRNSSSIWWLHLTKLKAAILIHIVWQVYLNCMWNGLLKWKKELTPPLPIMMVINIDNETCHLSLLSGPIKKSILSFPVHDGQKCIICVWDKTIQFSPAVRQIISAQERTLSWIFHRQYQRCGILFHNYISSR